MQTLETRRLLAAVSWDGGASTLEWTDAANWSTNTLPGVNDDVTINIAASNPTITLSSGIQIIHSLTSSEALNVSAGELSLAAASSTSAAFAVSGGTLSGAGTLNVNAAFTWSGGTMAGSGSTIANAGATLTLPNSGYLTLNGTRTLRLASGAATYGGPGAANGYSIIRNVGASPRIEVASGVTFTVSGEADFTADFGSNGSEAAVISVEAGGTFRHSGVGVTRTTEWAVNNAGTFNADAGTISINGGGTSSAAITVTAGATLRFISSYALVGGGSVSGAGNVFYDAGTHNLAGNLSLSSPLTIAGATVNFNAAQTLAGLNLQGGTLAGSGAVSVSGALNWTGGTMAGTGSTIANGGATLTLPSSDYLRIDGTRTLRLANGAASFGGPGATNGYSLVRIVGSSPRIEVATGATFTLTAEADLTADFGSNGTENAVLSIEAGGTLAHSGAGASRIAGWQTNNAGTINVLTGTLAINGGGTTSGTMSVAAGSILRFAGDYAYTGNGGLSGAGDTLFDAGTHNFAGNFAVTSPLAILNAIVNFNGVQALTGVNLQGGTLGGSGTVTVSGAFNWTGGTMAGTGRTIANGGATLTLPTTDYLRMNDTRTLRLAGGTASYGGPGAIGGYSLVRGVGGSPRIEIASGVTLTLTGEADLTADFGSNGSENAVVRIEPGGTLRHAGVGETRIVGWRVDNGGTVDAQAGTLSINGGGTSSSSLTISLGATLRFGDSFAYTGGGGLSGAGNVFFDNGSHNFAGNYAVTSPLTLTGTNAVVNFNAAQTLAALSVQAGTLGGAGVVSVTGAFSWSGGTLAGSGSTIANGGATLSLPNTNYLYASGTRTLRFANGAATFGGPGAVSGYSILRLPGASPRVEIASGVTLTVDGEADFTADFGSSGGEAAVLRVETGGTLRHTNAGTTRVAGWRFENTGTVDLQAGTLSLLDTTNVGVGAFLTAGRYLVANGTTLNFAQPVTTLAAEIDIASTGVVSGLGTLSTNRGRIGLNGGADFATTPDGGTFVDEGIIDLSPGSLFAVTGNMRLAGVSQPIVRAEIASGVNFGRLTISGTLDLNSPNSTSRFDPDLVGGYNPAPGTRHDIIVATGGITNAFDSFFGGPTPGGNTLLLTRPNATTIAVNVGSGSPPPAPQLLSQAYDFQTRQAVVFTFNQDVSAFLSRKDYSILNLTTGQTLAQSVGTLSYNQTSNQAVLTLTGALADGNYRLSVQAGDIANPAGVPLTAPLTLDFFVLAGDSDRDRDVDFDDLLALARNYEQAGRNLSQGNFNYSADGVVNFDDLLALARNYGKTLPPPAAAGEASATITRKRVAGHIVA